MATVVHPGLLPPIPEARVLALIQALFPTKCDMNLQPDDTTRPKPAGSSPTSSVTERIRDGDRQAAAELVLAESAMLRRRYRQRLDRSLRRICDSHDLVSTILRRLDRLVAARAVRASSLAEVRSLVHVIAENALADKARVLRRVVRSEQLRSQEAHPARTAGARPRMSAATLSGLPRAELHSVIRSIPDPADRQLLTLWLMGNSLHQAAAAMGMEPAAARKRWQRLRLALRGRLEGSLRDGSFLQNVP